MSGVVRSSLTLFGVEHTIGIHFVLEAAQERFSSVARYLATVVK